MAIDDINYGVWIEIVALVLGTLLLQYAFTCRKSYANIILCTNKIDKCHKKFEKCLDECGSPTYCDIMSF